MSTTTAPTDRPATLTVPAAYLEDARNAAAREVNSTGDMLRENHADYLRRGDTPDDRDSAACILARDTQLLNEILSAEGEIVLTSAQDRQGCPLVEMLEQMVRVLAERLSEAAGYAPVAMGDVLQVTERLRWAATEAIRIEPSIAGAAMVVLTREQRDAFCQFVRDDVTGHLVASLDPDELRALRERLGRDGAVLDRLGWEEHGDRESYPLAVDVPVLAVAKEVRSSIEGALADDLSGLLDLSEGALEFDRAALAAVDAIEAIEAVA